MPEHLTGQGVLLVEDDDTDRDALATLLEVGGYAVSTAKNGQEALARLRTGPPPDLILLDLIMPVMDGYEFRRVQREDAALASIPVVVLTGLGEDDDWADLLGEVGYVLKPVDEGLLLGVIRRFLAPQRPEVLVVDDEAGVRQLLDVALTHYGFTVRLAASGPEAVEVYRAHRQTVTLVLLDVQMPEMDGPATLAALRAIDWQVRCCFMSGHTGKYSQEELLGIGASHVLPKPFKSLGALSAVLLSAVQSS